MTAINMIFFFPSLKLGNTSTFPAYATQFLSPLQILYDVAFGF